MPDNKKQFTDDWTVEDARRSLDYGDGFWEASGRDVARLLLAEIDRLRAQPGRAASGPQTHPDCPVHPPDIG